jgi:hypothetical protein
MSSNKPIEIQPFVCGPIIVALTILCFKLNTVHGNKINEAVEYCKNRGGVDYYISMRQAAVCNNGEPNGEPTAH